MTIDRNIATGDLCIFLPLMIPGVGSGLVDLLLSLNRTWSLPGDLALTGLSPLLLTLMGALGVGFAWARLSAPPGTLLRPALVIKSIAVILFGWAVAQGAPAILLVLAAADAIAAVLLAIQWRAAAGRAV